MPPRLHVPLAAPGLWPLRLAQWAMVTFALAALVWTGSLLLESRQLEQAAQRYEESSGRLHEHVRALRTTARAEGFDLSESRLQGLAEEVRFANSILAKRAFSWTKLLANLEEAVPKGVSLESVRVTFAEARITLRGAALTPRHLTDLVDRLERHQAFDSVVVSRHHRKRDETEHGGPGGAGSSDLVTFELTVEHTPRKR